MVRTCLGCSRKALLPPSARHIRPPGDKDGQFRYLLVAEDIEWVPTAARSWVVDALLEAVESCLFCGNRFICNL